VCVCVYACVCARRENEREREGEKEGEREGGREAGRQGGRERVCVLHSLTQLHSLTHTLSLQMCAILEGMIGNQEHMAREREDRVCTLV